MRSVVSVSANIAFDSHPVAFVKLYHAIAGLYLWVPLHRQDKRMLTSSWNNASWETVFTAGFELDVLRGKRPYRWTIWVSTLLHMVNYHHFNECSYTSEHAIPSFLASSAS